MTNPAPLPLVDLEAQRRRLGPDLDHALHRVLEHGQFIMGPEVAELEAALERRADAAAAVTCGSGTQALLLPLMAWGVGPGDAVYVPAFTFPATAEVVALLGASPVFVDVRADTFNLDARSLSAAVADSARRGLRPRVVIAVDLFGQPADYEAITPVIRDAGLRLLADAAQSFGAASQGAPVGRLGDATAVSFFPSKPLGCYGDGGAVLTDDVDLAEHMRSIRSHGRGAGKYDIVRVGINGRLDTLQAAVLLAKLRIFDDELARRQTVADRYAACLPEPVPAPVVLPGTSSAWAQYTVQLAKRDQVADSLRRDGVASAVYYPAPLTEAPAYRHFSMAPTGVPVAGRLATRVLSLPMHPYLSDGDVERVVKSLSAAIGV